MGYDVEIDVRIIESNIFLGHDTPDHKVDLGFLKERERHLWCHAKNIEAFLFLLDKEIHCFWQERDDYSLTSRGFLFTHSRITKPTKKSIIFSDIEPISVVGAAGVCSDYIARYKNE